jgi:hypothetical protein
LRDEQQMTCRLENLMIHLLFSLVMVIPWGLSSLMLTALLVSSLRDLINARDEVHLCLSVSPTRVSFSHRPTTTSSSIARDSGAQVILNIAHSTSKLQIQQELRICTQSTAGEILPGPHKILNVFLPVRSQLLNECFLKQTSALERAISLHHSVWMNTLCTKKLEQLRRHAFQERLRDVAGGA